MVSACFNEPNYSDTPEISFKQLSKFTLAAGGGVGQPRRDSVIVTIGFQDGSGDLGEDIRDTARINRTFGREAWGNYEIKTFQLVEGKYEELDLAVLNKLFFPRLTREGQRGAIEGTLDFSQIFAYQRNFRMTPVKFQIRIRDRAMRVSNVAESDTIHVPLSGR
ncbi:hypothetical protein GCM10023189_07540 [Nibrella saemangeumensis]|uniref:Uncharacterized protein n=2 Tax=Nibrella saemangeumensis TaxID=1084526 RepID=A0ABP8MEA5_9BACT